MFSFSLALTYHASYDSNEASSGEDLNFWVFQESESNQASLMFTGDSIFVVTRTEHKAFKSLNVHIYAFITQC